MRFEKPTASWPRVSELEGGGTRINGTYAQPWLASAMPVLFGVFVLVHSGMLLAGTGSVAAGVIWGVFLTLFYRLLWKHPITTMLGKIVDVRVYQDRIRIRQGFFWRTYDRRMPILFGNETCRSGYDVQVVMQYGERRVVIATMPVADTDRAESLLARLQDAMEETRPAASVSAERKRTRAYSPYSSAAHLYG